MAQDTKIQWTDATVNFWAGCKKVSPGCKYCYMYRDQERWATDPTEVRQVSEKTINKTLKALGNKPSKIFTCSWSDFFIEEADQWREWAWNIIRENPQHQWQILTKRPERIKQCLPPDWGKGWDNVWLGVSVESENQTERIFELCHVPAKIRFISYEPAVGPISIFTELKYGIWDLNQDVKHTQKIHWVIIGGESGNGSTPEQSGIKYGYRASELFWFDAVIGMCKSAGVPVFMKQVGTHLAKEWKLKDKSGGDINEWPEELKVRQFPDINNILQNELSKEVHG